ncbi:MAG: NUDIX domain-containing protein [Pseudonocardiaceae bacterium]
MIDDQASKTEPDTPTPITDSPPRSTSWRRPSSIGPVNGHFNGWRRQWELPGGMREPAETARQAAVHEPGEETGIGTVDLNFVAVAEVDLRRPEPPGAHRDLPDRPARRSPTGAQRRGIGVLVVGSTVTADRADEPTRHRDRKTHDPPPKPNETRRSNRTLRYPMPTHTHADERKMADAGCQPAWTQVRWHGRCR